MKIEDIIKKHKTISKVNSHLSGKKVKVKFSDSGIFSGHSLPEDTQITIIRCNNSLQAPYFGNFTCTTPQGQRTLYGCELKFNGDTIDTIKDDIRVLEESISRDQSEIELLNTKIKFMQKNNLKEFDETDFTVYAALEQLENPKLSKVQRAQAIAKLVKG